MNIEKFGELCENEYQTVIYQHNKTKKGWAVTCILTIDENTSFTGLGHDKDLPIAMNNAKHHCLRLYSKYQKLLNTVTISNLSPKTTHNNLKSICEQYGEVSCCNINNRRAIIQMKSPKAAKQVVTHLQGKIINGNYIDIFYGCIPTENIERQQSPKYQLKIPVQSEIDINKFIDTLSEQIFASINNNYNK